MCLDIFELGQNLLGFQTHEGNRQPWTTTCPMRFAQVIKFWHEVEDAFHEIFQIKNALKHVRFFRLPLGCTIIPEMC